MNGNPCNLNIRSTNKSLRNGDTESTDSVTVTVPCFASG